MPAAAAKRFFKASGIVILPVLSTHILALKPLPRHHDNPVDWLLVETALTEPCRLVKHDAHLAAYGPIVTVV